MHPSWWWVVENDVTTKEATNEAKGEVRPVQMRGRGRPSSVNISKPRAKMDFVDETTDEKAESLFEPLRTGEVTILYVGPPTSSPPTIKRLVYRIREFVYYSTSIMLDSDEEQASQRNNKLIRYQAELASYRRYLRCMGLTLVFWFAMLYFIAHDDNTFVIAGVVLLLLWIFYMCVCICGNVYLRFRDDERGGENHGKRVPSDGGGADDEEAGLTSAANSSSLTASPEGTATFPYSFPETSKRIRACPRLVVAGKGPTNGTYTAVFSAIFFNKPVRSEGKLRLEFHATHDNGWTVEGESQFGTITHALKEGFVNAKGEMYWKSGDTIHRGVLDFEHSNTMFDGEFAACTSNRLLSRTNGDVPIGRIVRLELLERATTLYSSSTVEMVSFAPGNAKDEDEDDEEATSLFS